MNFAGFKVTMAHRLAVEWRWTAAKWSQQMTALKGGLVSSTIPMRAQNTSLGGRKVLSGRLTYE